MEGPFNLKITISKDTAVFKEFNEEISFKKNLGGYRNILKKLQKETNNALTELVNQENSADIPDIENNEDDDEDEEADVSSTPKRKNSCENNNKKISKH